MDMGGIFATFGAACQGTKHPHLCALDANMETCATDHISIRGQLETIQSNGHHRTIGGVISETRMANEFVVYRRSPRTLLGMGLR